jgi:hypothetical protein
MKPHEKIGEDKEGDGKNTIVISLEILGSVILPFNCLFN